MQKLTELLLAFMQIGALNFGGGYAMIPFLQAESTRRGWLTLTEFADIVAISQITPGPVAVNMATFIGYRQGGLPGALIATFGVCFPSFIAMSILVRFFKKFAEAPIIRRIFFGLRPTVTGLIFAAVIAIAQLEFIPNGFYSISAVDIKSFLIFISCLFAMLKLKINPIICLTLSAFAGLFLFE